MHRRTPPIERTETAKGAVPPLIGKAFYGRSRGGDHRGRREKMKAETSCGVEEGGVPLLALRSRHSSVIRRLLYVAAFVAVFSSCCRTAEIIARWQCGVMTITVYKDGIASFSGARATWSTISSEAIRLEFGEKEELGVAELRVKSKGENKLRTATFNVGGVETACSELPSKEEGG